MTGSGGPGARPLCTHWRQTFVYTDVVEPGELAPEALVILLNQLERGIRHVLIIVPPPSHQAHRVVVDLGGIRDVVPLPGVGPVLVDLLLHVLEVALADVQHAVRHHASRAGDLVDEVPGRRRLRGRDRLGPLGFHVVPWRAVLDPRLTAIADRRRRHRGDVAQQPDRHLAVEKDVLDELDELEVRGAHRQADQRRIPRPPHLAPFVHAPCRARRVALAGRRSLGRRPQGVAARDVGAAHQVELVVEHEQVARDAGLGVRRRFEHLDRIDAEESPEHLVHRQQGGRHAAGRGEERAPIDPQLLAGGLGEILDARLDSLLRRGLRDRHVLAVGDHARRDGRPQRFRRVRPRTLGDLIVIQQTVIVVPRLPGFIPLVDRHQQSPGGGAPTRGRDVRAGRRPRADPGWRCVRLRYAGDRGPWGSILRDAVQIPVPAHVDLVADEGHRRAEVVVQRVGREHLERFTVPEHDGRAVASRDVHPTVGCHR